MALDALRYDQVAFRGVHNSIDRGVSITEQLAGTGPVVGPCTALELDLHQASDDWRWEVKHGAGDSGVAFRDVLDEIVTWSDAHPGHTVVTVHLDLKNDPGSHRTFATELDERLLDVFGDERIYRPAEVMGDHPDLVRGARAGGWATLGALRGRFVFCLSGRVRRKNAYAAFEPRRRLCFADFAGSRGPRRTGDAVFANLFVDAQHYSAYLGDLVRCAGYVTRGYNIVTQRNWRRAIDLGLNILSGDILDDPAYSFGEAGCRALDVARRRRG